MSSRPSEPLLAFLRDAIRRKGLSTAELAERVGRERGDIKRALAGTDPLTVDDLVLLSQALQLTPAELGLASADLPEAPEPTDDHAPIPLRIAPRDAPPEPEGADPLGNLPEQTIRLAFTLGLDFFADCDTARLTESGIPAAVRAQNAKGIRLQFPAKYHKHNRPAFEEETFGCRLSFDRIYDCVIPWPAIRVVSFLFPDEAPPPPPPAPEGPKRPALRVVK